MIKNFDTIIVPCRDSVDNEKMLNDGYWQAVRIAEYRKSNVKYIAIYHTAPTSAITECYEVINLETWEDDKGKYRITFKKSPIKTPLVKYNRNNNDPIIQGSRYTLLEKLQKAKSLKDLFN